MLDWEFFLAEDRRGHLPGGEQLAEHATENYSIELARQQYVPYIAVHFGVVYNYYCTRGPAPNVTSRCALKYVVVRTGYLANLDMMYASPTINKITGTWNGFRLPKTTRSAHPNAGHGATIEITQI